MRCHLVTKHLDNLLDGTLSHSMEAPLLNHIAACNSCHQAWSEARTLQLHLRHRSVPSMPNGMVERLLKRAHGEVHLTRQRMAYGWAASFVMILAGGLIWSMVAMFSAPQQLPVIAINEARTVQVVFNSPEAITPAEFVIHLPDGIELAGYEGERTVRWQGRLAQGRNLLELPLKATRSITGEVVAVIHHADEQKQFSLQVQGRLEPRTATDSGGHVT